MAYWETWQVSIFSQFLKIVCRFGSFACPGDKKKKMWCGNRRCGQCLKTVFPVLLNDFTNSSRPELLTSILLTCARRMLGLLFLMMLMVNERRVWFLGPVCSIITDATSVYVCCDDSYIHCDFLSTNPWWFCSSIKVQAI